jgi:hypothetical protein
MAKRESKRAVMLRPARAMMAMATKKAAVAKKIATAASKAATGTVVGTTVTKMPSSMTAAATSQGIYLYANDVWAQRYFDPNDLHSVERELFG